MWLLWTIWASELQQTWELGQAVNSSCTVIDVMQPFFSQPAPRLAIYLNLSISHPLSLCLSLLCHTASLLHISPPLTPTPSSTCRPWRLLHFFIIPRNLCVDLSGFAVCVYRHSSLIYANSEWGGIRPQTGKLVTFIRCCNEHFKRDLPDLKCIFISHHKSPSPQRKNKSFTVAAKCAKTTWLC